MKSTLLDLFASKKFLAAVTASVIYVAGRLGFDVDTAVLDHIFAAFLVYVGAQAVADHGKSAAEVREAAFGNAIRIPAGLETGAAVREAKISDSLRDPQAGRARLPVLITLGLLAVALCGAIVIVPGCTAAQRTDARQDAANGLVAALGCEADHVDAAMLADAEALGAAKVTAWLTGVAPGDMATLRARMLVDLRPIRTDLVRCAIAGALAAATAIATPQSGAAVQGLTSAAGPDPALVRAAFASAAREVGWAPVRVAGVTL